MTSDRDGLCRASSWFVIRRVLGFSALLLVWMVHRRVCAVGFEGRVEIRVMLLLESWIRGLLEF